MLTDKYVILDIGYCNDHYWEPPDKYKILLNRGEKVIKKHKDEYDNAILGMWEYLPFKTGSIEIIEVDCLSCMITVESKYKISKLVQTRWDGELIISFDMYNVFDAIFDRLIEFLIETRGLCKLLIFAPSACNSGINQELIVLFNSILNSADIPHAMSVNGTIVSLLLSFDAEFVKQFTELKERCKEEEEERVKGGCGGEEGEEG